ncbi:MAG: ABC transporter ATP-binding protein/permease [bacterium]|nr:ABC transporter ATP-binding protein/permease [bacterium]
MDNEIKRLPKAWSVLEIKDLSFSYHTQDDADLHLDDISLKIKNGERIAFIGESGGGKSTLLKVIRDLYHPKTLSVSADDNPLKNGFKDFSDSVSLIPQDPEIFATTVRENITLGVEYSDEDLKKYTDIACFTDVASRLPHGLESSIVEKGVNLSGGERQRLALSRGLLASEDKDIILFDEPTSSVDFKNELQIYKNIFDAFSTKTIISSIHRLHLLSLFDFVYFLKDGKIIARGTFEELKQNSPEFVELWAKYIHTRDTSPI